jgi:hypothetical protein
VYRLDQLILPDDRTVTKIRTNNSDPNALFRKIIRSFHLRIVDEEDAQPGIEMSRLETKEQYISLPSPFARLSRSRENGNRRSRWASF